MTQQLPVWPDRRRANTGVVQFGNDWPGVFIRGDEAMGFAAVADAALRGSDQLNDPLVRKHLQRLLDVLKASELGPEQ